MNKVKFWVLLILAAIFATGCGIKSEESNNVTIRTINVNVLGVVGINRMKNADIAIHEVSSSGVMMDAPLASTKSSSLKNAEGTYSINFTGNVGSLYMLVASSNSDASEIDPTSPAERKIPKSFKLRAPIIFPETNGSTSITVSASPLSEMIVNASIRSGGLTINNVKRGIATSTATFGFDPVGLDRNDDVKPSVIAYGSISKAIFGIASGRALGPESNVSDVSKQKDSMGCAGKIDGEALECVVNKMASAASLSEIKFEISSIGVAFAGVLKIIAPKDPYVALIFQNLNCVEKCDAPTPVEASAVQKAKSLLSNLRSVVSADLKEMFAQISVQSANDSAYLQAQVFNDTFSKSTMPVRQLYNQFTALSMCVLWGEESPRSDGEISNNYNYSWGGFFNCRSNTGIIVVEMVSQEINTCWYSGCSSYEDVSKPFYRSRQTLYLSPLQSQRHAYSMASSSGVYVYPDGITEVFEVSDPLPDPRPIRLGDINSGSGAGVVKLIFDSSGKPVSLSLDSVEFPGQARINGYSTPLTGRMDVNRMVVSGSISTSIAEFTIGILPTAPTMAVMNGNVHVFRAGSKGALPDESLSVKLEADVSLNENLPEITAFRLSDLVWSASPSRMMGSLIISDFSWDKFHTEYYPSRIKLVGELLNSEDDGVSYQTFLSGSAEVLQTGWSFFDASKNSGRQDENNFTNLSINVSGELTAPNRPRLLLGLSVYGRGYLGGVESFQAQLRSVKGTGDSFAISIGGNKNANVVTLNDAVTGLSMIWPNGADEIVVKSGAVHIATIKRSTGLIYYKDGTFESLASGSLLQGIATN